MKVLFLLGWRLYCAKLHGVCHAWIWMFSSLELPSEYIYLGTAFLVYQHRTQSRPPAIPNSKIVTRLSLELYSQFGLESHSPIEKKGISGDRLDRVRLYNGG
jgi:hypothetical protein